MRYSPEEKMEIIRLVEGSNLGAKRTLEELGVAKSTFYSLCQKHISNEPLEKQTKASYWNRIPDEYKAKVIETALEFTQLSPCEIATHMTDRSGHFISESSVSRILKNVVVKLEHYYLPQELEYRLAEFVEYYNIQRYHESLQNCTPEDVYLGRQKEILERRSRIKQKSMQRRRKNHRLEMIKL